jgi:hypothetical protein
MVANLGRARQYPCVHSFYPSVLRVLSFGHVSRLRLTAVAQHPISRASLALRGYEC